MCFALWFPSSCHMSTWPAMYNKTTEQWSRCWVFIYAAQLSQSHAQTTQTSAQMEEVQGDICLPAQVLTADSWLLRISLKIAQLCQSSTHSPIADATCSANYVQGNAGDMRWTATSYIFPCFIGQALKTCSPDPAVHQELKDCHKQNPAYHKRLCSKVQLLQMQL